MTAAALNGDFGEIADGQKTILRHALENEGLILRLIQNMNMIMDIEAGVQMIHKSPTAISSLVLSVGKSFTAQIKLKNIKFKSIQPKKKISALKIDAEKMRMVLDIIFDNAVRYTHEGGSITARVSSTKNGVKISITDTGIGIPEAEQDNIFDRFFRASNAHSMHTDGIGLGLYLAKYVVEAHGGKIGFKSAEGKGSTFSFEIPV